MLKLYILLLLFSFLTTYLIRQFALRHKILDIPNERSSHSVPTPRGGGLAIVIAWYAGISVLFFLGYIEKQLFLAFLSGILLAGISIIDDLYNIKPLIRFSVQIITAFLAFLSLGGMNQIELSGFVINSKLFIYPVTIIGIVWFINLFNFLDGIDGYASMEAIMVSLVMYLLTGNIACLILIFSVMGFLIWNWPKAKIFMGDIGSTQLGFILIVLGIYFHNQNHLSIINWLMLSSLFWFDATLTLFRRWRNKETLTKAHKKHAYQRIVQSGFSHSKTLLFLIIINLVIILLVYLTIYFDFLLIPLFVLNIMFLYGITTLIDRKIPFSKV